MNNCTNCTCGTCLHWVPLEADPKNLGAEKQGECRESPPSFTMYTLPVRGVVQLVGCTKYPQTQYTFPACSRYKKSPELDTDSVTGYTE